MLIREAAYADVDEILRLYEQAREYFRANGIPQWLDGKPDYDDVFGDIDDGISYVAAENGRIAAVFACDFFEDMRYPSLLGGSWLNGDEYAGLHRVAVNSGLKRRGIGSEIVKFVLTRCFENGVFNIRCDTHPKNAPMRGMLEKNGFCKCGRFYLANGEERVAYHLELNQ